MCGKLDINGDVDHWSLLGSPAPKDYGFFSRQSSEDVPLSGLYNTLSLAKRGLSAPGLLREVVSCETDTAREGRNWPGTVLGRS